MGFAAATFEAARQTLLLLLQNRLLWIVCLLQAGAALLIFALAGNTPRDVDGRLLCAMVSWWLLGNLLLPLTTIYFGVHAVHGDIEDRTFQFLFLRPVSRASILLGKWLAVAGLCTVVFVVGAGLLFAAVAARPAIWSYGVDPQLALVFMAAMALSALAHAAVATLFATRLRRPLITGAFYVFGVQLLLGNLAARASVRALTIADPVRRFVLYHVDANARLARALWPSEREWRDELVGAPILDLAVIVLVCLLLAVVFYSRSEYDSRPRE